MVLFIEIFGKLSLFRNNGHREQRFIMFYSIKVLVGSHTDRIFDFVLKLFSELAFLVDISKHMNVLNIKLQGNKLFEHVCAFEVKLLLWLRQLKQSNYENFPMLSASQPIESTIVCCFC